jgi:hypothetical protein
MVFLVLYKPLVSKFSRTRSLHGIGTSDEDCAHLDRKQSHKQVVTINTHEEKINEDRTIHMRRISMEIDQYTWGEDQ